MEVETRAPWSIQAHVQALSLKDVAVTQARDVASSRQKTLRPRPIPHAKAVPSTRKQTAAAKSSRPDAENHTQARATQAQQAFCVL